MEEPTEGLEEVVVVTQAPVIKVVVVVDIPEEEVPTVSVEGAVALITDQIFQLMLLELEIQMELLL
jgi:hypothetical protein